MQNFIPDKMDWHNLNGEFTFFGRGDKVFAIACKINILVETRDFAEQEKYVCHVTILD